MVIDPLHRRRVPPPQDINKYNANGIDLRAVHMPEYATPLPSGALPDLRPLANSLFDARAAAAIKATVGDPAQVLSDPMALLEKKDYGDKAPPILILTSKCLAAMAYADYFHDNAAGQPLRDKVSDAIMQAVPGWCGTFGPGVTGAISLLDSNRTEGNYDITQMHLLPLAYCFFDELHSDAAERLITTLLARGLIQRPNDDDTFTSGVTPNDWSRAGFVSPDSVHVDISETENHVLMIACARYLTNQLLYQRTHDQSFDNRRNGNPDDSRPTCMDQVLMLLRNYLKDDFAEYNAKPYQEETRHALLNLCTFAYDSEVRLAAEMVLDYISARIAVSSNDLRRLVPFRRRNEEPYVTQLSERPGFMAVGLFDVQGADPITSQFALLAGNTRAYRLYSGYVMGFGFGPELTLSALSAYRLPSSIHDLFVNDMHRRFYQRLHRRPMEEPGQQRNCENREIYAGSPSYLISAGGAPATYVIPGKVVGVFKFGFDARNLGVAMPSTILVTGSGNGAIVDPANTSEQIQVSCFSAQPADGDQMGGTANYGVAPDFLCGFKYYFPEWTGVPKDKDGVFYVNKGGSNTGELEGFYLAVIKSGDFVVIEAFDTWRYPNPKVTIDQFIAHVKTDNPDVRFVSGKEMIYTTFFGNRIHYVIWSGGEIDGHTIGSKILSIEYGNGNPADTLAAAGDDSDQSKFLSGTVMQSTGDALVTITNPAMGTQITLDWRDWSLLVRVAEDGSVERAGRNASGQHYEAWVDFDWTGDHEGDFFRPFNTIADAVASLADGGTVRIMPGTTAERPANLTGGKRVRFVAPLGGVRIGGG
jgi:hypothetical protein